MGATPSEQFTQIAGELIRFLAAGDWHLANSSGARIEISGACAELTAILHAGRPRPAVADRQEELEQAIAHSRLLDHREGIGQLPPPQPQPAVDFDAPKARPDAPTERAGITPTQ